MSRPASEYDILKQGMEKLWARQDQILDNQQSMLKKLDLLVERTTRTLQTDDIKDDLHLEVNKLYYTVAKIRQGDGKELVQSFVDMIGEKFPNTIFPPSLRQYVTNKYTAMLRRRRRGMIDSLRKRIKEAYHAKMVDDTDTTRNSFASALKGDADWRERLVRAAIQDCKEWVHDDTNLPDTEPSHSEESLTWWVGYVKKACKAPINTVHTAIFSLIDQEGVLKKKKRTLREGATDTTNSGKTGKTIERTKRQRLFDDMSDDEGDKGEAASQPDVQLESIQSQGEVRNEKTVSSADHFALLLGFEMRDEAKKPTPASKSTSTATPLASKSTSTATPPANKSTSMVTRTSTATPPANKSTSMASKSTSMASKSTSTATPITNKSTSTATAAVGVVPSVEALSLDPSLQPSLDSLSLAMSEAYTERDEDDDSSQLERKRKHDRETATSDATEDTHNDKQPRRSMRVCKPSVLLNEPTSAASILSQSSKRVRLYTASLRSADVRGKGVVSYNTSLVRGASKFEQYISDLPDWALPPEGGKELWDLISDATGASDCEWDEIEQRLVLKFEARMNFMSKKNPTLYIGYRC